jgi:anaerobic magnesium-protoporphyrin IX monomethyl ester cyclase
MHISLIIPPSVFLADEKVFVSLGILRVAAVLEQTGHTVSVLDLSNIKNYADVAALHADSTTADVFGVTATTPQWPAAEQIIQAMRTARPDARILVGGPHVTTTHASAKRLGKDSRAMTALQHILDVADCLVCGDGERAIFPALAEDAPPIVDADNLRSEMFLSAEALADYPFPARHLIDMDSYHYAIDDVPTTSIIAQLGCPFGCTFCGARLSPSFRKSRIRPIENVLAEIRHLHESWGYSGFMFFDDELNVNPRLLDDLQAMRRLQDDLQTEFRCRGFLKAELITEPICQAMYAAGFRNILIGFESGSPRILENIKKRATLDDNTRAVEMAKRSGLQVKAAMSCGHAGETAETIEATRNWLIQVEPDEFDLTCITVYPSTPYYDQAVESQAGIWTYTAQNGDRLHSLNVDFSAEPQYYKGVPGDYHSYVYTDALQPEDLVQLRNEVEVDVRHKLGIPPYPISAPAMFEHSMGQGLPNTILRESNL